MPATELEHYLIVSERLEETRAFYCDVIGMHEGFRPEVGFDGYWLYLGDVACMHLADKESYREYKARIGTPEPQQTNDTGAIDHIAFNATGFADMIARLEQRKLDYRQNLVEGIRLKQIFVQDPNAVTLELNFPE